MKGGSVLWQEPEDQIPLSQIKLTPGEFEKLLAFLHENKEHLRTAGIKFSGDDSDSILEELEKFKEFRVRSSTDIKTDDQLAALRFIEDHNLLTADMRNALIARGRLKDLEQFKHMLTYDSLEPEWQVWFERNTWVLGSDYVAVLDDRQIDGKNIADYLVQAADLYLDIIEIKKPSMQFWFASKDHDNLVPYSDLIRAWTQCENYIYEIEREMNSIKTADRISVPIAKPRATLVYGRSIDWKKQHFRAQRLLNAGLSNIQITTYDQVLAKAERNLALISQKTEAGSEE